MGLKSSLKIGQEKNRQINIQILEDWQQMGYFRVPHHWYENDFFYSHANINHFHNKGFSINLVLKVKV